ncbi:MAG: T9SS type A sorting domain-containing protein [Clostridia bacterium]|nr:T9SS type A sorting domain-containing protein [Clostridia bacterium]
MKKVKSLLALILAMLIAFGGTVCAFAADPEETEENSTLATADVFGLGSSIKGKIGDINDVDIYTFTAAESGLVTVTLAHDKKTDADAIASYYKVSVLDSKGEEIDSFKSAGSDAEASIDFSVTPAVYYVKVEWDRVLDDSLEYTLSAKINKTALFEKEPNDITSQATAMTLSKKGDNKLYYGAITEGDVDYYQVTFSKPSLALFGIYNTTSKAGSYKASLVKVVDGLNGAPAEKVVGSISINSGEEVKDSPLFGVNGGTYYLKVEGVGASTGGYQVRVYAGDSNSTDEFEYNNEEKYSNLIAAGKYVTGNVFDASDVDIFRFNAPKDNNGYEITFVDYDNKQEVTNGQWTIEVVDANGSVVEDKVTVLNSEKVVAETDALEAGVYYIKVTAGNNFTGETYKLSLAEKKASEEDKKDDDDVITIDEFLADLGAIDWSGFWKNFEGWLEYVNVFGIISDLMASVMDFITTFVFANM